MSYNRSNSPIQKFAEQQERLIYELELKLKNLGQKQTSQQQYMGIPYFYGNHDEISFSDWYRYEYKINCDRYLITEEEHTNVLKSFLNGRARDIYFSMLEDATPERKAKLKNFKTLLAELTKRLETPEEAQLKKFELNTMFQRENEDLVTWTSPLKNTASKAFLNEADKEFKSRHTIERFLVGTLSRYTEKILDFQDSLDMSATTYSAALSQLIEYAIKLEASQRRETAYEKHRKLSHKSAQASVSAVKDEAKEEIYEQVAKVRQSLAQMKQSFNKPSTSSSELPDIDPELLTEAIEKLDQFQWQCDEDYDC